MIWIDYNYIYTKIISEMYIYFTRKQSIISHIHVKQRTVLHYVNKYMATDTIFLIKESINSTRSNIFNLPVYLRHKIQFHTRHLIYGIRCITSHISQSDYGRNGYIWQANHGTRYIWQLVEVIRRIAHHCGNDHHRYRFQQPSLNSPLWPYYNFSVMSPSSWKF